MPIFPPSGGGDAGTSPFFSHEVPLFTPIDNNFTDIHLQLVNTLENRVQQVISAEATFSGWIMKIDSFTADNGDTVTFEIIKNGDPTGIKLIFTKGGSLIATSDETLVFDREDTISLSMTLDGNIFSFEDLSFAFNISVSGEVVEGIESLNNQQQKAQFLTQGDAIGIDSINGSHEIKVNDLQITESKLADNSVSNEKIQAGAVETDNIDNLAVDNSKIADKSIKIGKLNSSPEIAGFFLGTDGTGGYEFISEAITKGIVSLNGLTDPTLTITNSSEADKIGILVRTNSPDNIELDIIPELITSKPTLSPHNLDQFLFFDPDTNTLKKSNFRSLQFGMLVNSLGAYTINNTELFFDFNKDTGATTIEFREFVVPYIFEAGKIIIDIKSNTSDRITTFELMVNNVASNVFVVVGAGMTGQFLGTNFIQVPAKALISIRSTRAQGHSGNLVIRSLALGCFQHEDLD